jgi:putative tryptophan/tyrosine transport system substrate-binding protein
LHKAWSLRGYMKRREFITLLGGALATWPQVVRAQQALPVIGFLNSASSAQYARMVTAFREGLSDAGYVEGQNVVIEFRWADGKYDRLPALAADLVRRRIAVIFANTPGVQAAAAAATTTIPIVFAVSGDPVKDGLVASLNRPGGTVTGVTQTNVEVTPKRLELLHELVPTANIMALLVNPTGPTLAEAASTNLQAASRTLGLELAILNASTERDFDEVFGKLFQLHAGGLVIGSDPFFTSQSERLAALSVRHAVPTIYQYREFTVAGGLLSYGGSITDSYRLGGVYTGRILKGERPADLPVQQSTKVELIVNLKTAKALGITVPLSLLGRADEVIE